MIKPESLEQLQSGAFGKIYTRSLLENIEALREQSEAGKVDHKSIFDNGAAVGDIIIEVTLTIKILGED